MNFESIIDWLSNLPLVGLYFAIGVISAIENIFPPFPSDFAVAFGSFLAARGAGSPYTTFLVAWAGNFIGAAIMYWLGRRLGSVAFVTRLERWAGAGAEKRMMRLYGRYGLPALFISRFLPAVRALVPPFAGAMRLPALPVAIAIGSASAIWFAFVTWVAFRAGENWEVLYATIKRSGEIVGLAAAALVVLFAVLLYIRRRRAARPVEPGDLPPPST